MKSDTWELGQIFENRRQYSVPFYQRTYTWVADRQWDRLWDDIEAKAEATLQDGQVTPHFLGAIVVEPQRRDGLRGVEVFNIVDGQQRLTTLQFVLHGIRLGLIALGAHDFDAHLEARLVNGSPSTMKDPAVEVFKVWPTHFDRVGYRAVMTAESLGELRQRFPNHYTNAGTLLKHGQHPAALAAVVFFAQRVQDYVTGHPNQDHLEVAEAVVTAVLNHLKIVEIMLEDGDDAQVIFETLNDKGAALNATDLVRNYIFMRADRDGSDDAAHSLYESLWTRFEAETWKVEDKRGRLTKPRLEWMVQSVLQVETQRDIEVSRLYAEYRAFCQSRGAGMNAQAQLEMLNRYADHYEAMATGQGALPIARLGGRMASFDVTTVFPLALQISVAGLPHAETREMFEDVTSFVVRRALCGLNNKNYNNLFMSAVRHLVKEGVSRSALRAFLSSSQLDTGRWPSDAEVRQACLTGDVFYGRLLPKAARQLLTEIEAVLRAGRKTEEPSLPSLANLDVEHIMPRSWYEHWPLSDGTHATQAEAERARYMRLNGEALSGRQQEILEREAATPTLGNITLLHLSVNRSASNLDFEEKKERMRQATNLTLNVPLLSEQSWDVAQIRDRGERYARIVLDLLPAPQPALAEAVA